MLDQRIKSKTQTGWFFHGFRILMMGMFCSVFMGVSQADQADDLEQNPELIAQFNLNVGSLALDERRYLDAISYFEAALESTERDKTRVQALLYLATTFTSFLNSPDSALKIYREIQKKYPDHAESAYYQETLLLFEQERYPEVMERVAAYLADYPSGRFKFQTEFLIDQSKREMQGQGYQHRSALYKKAQDRADAIARKTAQRRDKIRKKREAANRARKNESKRLRAEADLMEKKLLQEEEQANEEVYAIAAQEIKKIKEPVVRVQLSKKAQQIKIKGQLTASSRGNTLWSGSELTINAEAGTIVFKSGGSTKEVSQLIVTSTTPISLVYDKRKKTVKKKVRGSIQLNAKKRGIQLLNLVKMEAYLRSVVPAESYVSWPKDALKAQTLAARTYAYNDVLNNAKKSFDVHDDIRSQVYAGISKEHKKTDQVIRETAGEVITAVRKGRLGPILAMFAANSGGHLADPAKEYSEHWDTSHYYLKAKKDPWSAKAGKKWLATWEFTHSSKEIEKNLRKRKVWVKNLSDIQPVYIGPSGRLVKVRLIHDGGKSTVIRFRPKVTLGLGGRIGTLPDTIVTIYKKGSQFLFDGKGFGHGIGYMQSGGMMMAKAGKNYKEILKFYYPGTNFTRYW